MGMEREMFLIMLTLNPNAYEFVLVEVQQPTVLVAETGTMTPTNVVASYLEYSSYFVDSPFENNVQFYTSQGAHKMAC